MPELPEVETYKRYIDSTALHQKIINAEVNNIKILENIRKEKVEQVLENSSIKQTVRIGKYLFLVLNNQYYLIFHFGMTGNIKYFKNSEKKPTHTRLLLTFSNHYHLAYDCQRLFGIVSLTDNIKDYIREKKLGPDALSIKKEEFFDQIKNRKTKIKSFLMNQKILSGIGNIYADEILFQSRIHPEKKCTDLTKKQIETIFLQIRSVLKTAIKHQAIIDHYPKTFLLPHRRKDNKCPLNQNHVFDTIKISGRTTYYCAKHQQL